MAPRQHKHRKKLIAGATGAVLAGGLIAWLAAHPKEAPRVVCGALQGAINGACEGLLGDCCSATRGIPLGPLDGQVKPGKAGCPHGSQPINGGCWLLLEMSPPCPDYVYSWDGRCWTPVMQPPGPPARIPNSQRK